MVLLIVLLAAIAAFLLRTTLLTGLARFLIIDDPLSPADIVVLLTGDTTTRPFRAAELIRKGVAPVVVICRAESSAPVQWGLFPNATDVNVGMLKKIGVADSKIIVLERPGGVTSTFDEAETVRDYVRRNKTSSMIIVSSALHTRRARWVFRKVLQGEGVAIRMSPVHHHRFSDTNWWTQEDGLLYCPSEYAKFLLYLWKY